MKYTVNENYFKEIDSPEKAYILGFLYADGCTSNNTISIVQVEENKDIIYKIRDILGNIPINQSKQTNGKIKYSIYIYRKNMVNDLINLGCIPNKSLTLTFPDFINDELLPHFIRGYFDGDGCIWNGKRKKVVVKDSRNKTGYRERIIHNVKFTITGNYTFISKLQNILVNKLGLSKTKLNFSKSKDVNNNTSSNICTMEYSGRKNSRKLFDFLYKDATIYLDKKFNKFNEIFCAFDEKSSNESGLTAGTPETVISNQAEKSEGSSTIPEMEVESSDSKCPAPNSKEKDGDIVSSNTK